jgi:hypothetical protein
LCVNRKSPNYYWSQTLYDSIGSEDKSLKRSKCLMCEAFNKPEHPRVMTDFGRWLETPVILGYCGQICFLIFFIITIYYIPPFNSPIIFLWHFKKIDHIALSRADNFIDTIKSFVYL